jgi:hypothetical protein
MRGTVAFALLVALPLVVSCHDPLTPVDLRGQYDLVSQDGRDLPQLLSATLECDVNLTGGLLTVFPDGKGFILDLFGSMDCSRGGGPVQALGWSYAGTFTLKDRQIEFSSFTIGGEAFTFGGSVQSNNTISIVIHDPAIPTAADLKPTFQRE